MTDPKVKTARSARRWLIAGSVLAVIAGAIWAYSRFLAPAVEPWVQRFGEWVSGLGPWAPLIFIAAYVVATVAFVPGLALTLIGGAVFGLWFGVLYAMAGASIGAALAFLIGRYVARRRVEDRVRASRRFAAIDRAIGRNGLWITVLLRLSPIFPFNFLNYALGLTRVRFLHYNIASLAMLPGSFLYTYVGHVGGRTLADVEGAGRVEWTVRAVGLAVTVAVTLAITRLARRALAEATEITESTATTKSELEGAAGKPRGDAPAAAKALPRDAEGE